MSVKLFRIYSNIFIFLIVFKVFDVIRNILVATNLGVSGSADVYMGLVTIPDSLLVLVGLDSIKGVINSELSFYDPDSQKDRMKIIFENIFNVILYVSLVFVVIIIIFRKDVVELLLPGFSEQKKMIAYSLSLILFPIFFFKSLIGLFHSFFNALKKFYIPVVLNGFPTLLVILSVYLPYYKNDLIYNLSISLNISQILVLIISVFLIIKFTGLIRLKFKFYDAETGRILRGCFSIFVLLISEQLFNFSKNYFASYFGDGAISSINYSRSVSMVIMGLFFTSVFSVFLSNLSTSFSQELLVKTKKLFFDTLLGLCFAIFFITLFVVVSGRELLSLLYLRGNFSIDALQMTLIPYYWESLSIITFILYIIPTALYLAKKKYHKLNIIGSTVYLSGILLIYLFTKVYGYSGVSMGQFTTTLIYAVLLLLGIRKILGRIKNEIYEILKMLAVTIISLIIILFIKEYIYNFYGLEIYNLIIIISANLIITAILYICFSYVLKIKILNLLYRRIFKFNG